MKQSAILSKLPYGSSFCFVDSIVEVNEQAIVGRYTFPTNLSVYESHFPDFPVTPGVLLIECMAQIGLVCLGIYLTEQIANQKNEPIFLSSLSVDFQHPVYPGETVTVQSEKMYFRFGKLKCKVVMKNEQGQTVCSGQLSGIQREKDER